MLCFVLRMLDGFLLGYIFRSVSKLNRVAACFVTGFACVLKYAFLSCPHSSRFSGKTEQHAGLLINGQNILLFICAFVGVNAVFEMLSSTVITGAVGSVPLKAGFIQTPAKKQIKREVLPVILAIDIGNTNIVIGCCADGQYQFTANASPQTPPQRCSEYAAMLKWRLI